MTITMKKQDLPTDPQQLADFLRLPSIDSLRKSIKRWKVVPGRFNRKHELLDYQINKIAEKYSQTGSNITKHQANIILEFFENNGFESGLSSDDSDYKLAESIGQETDSSETDRITTNFSRMKNRTAKRTRCVQADNGQPSGQDASKRTNQKKPSINSFRESVFIFNNAWAYLPDRWCCDVGNSKGGSRTRTNYTSVLFYCGCYRRLCSPSKCLYAK